MREAAIYCFGAIMTVIIYATGTALYDNAMELGHRRAANWIVAGVGAAMLVLTICVMEAL